MSGAMSISAGIDPFADGSESHPDALQEAAKRAVVFEAAEAAKYKVGTQVQVVTLAWLSSK